MNNKDFLKELAQRLSITQKEANNYLAHLTDCMTECFVNGDAITFAKLGTIAPHKKAARTTRLPNAQEEITTPEKNSIIIQNICLLQRKVKSY